MAITQGMCDSFKVQILSGQQNLVSGASPVYKLALYTSYCNIEQRNYCVYNCWRNV